MAQWSAMTPEQQQAAYAQYNTAAPAAAAGDAPPAKRQNTAVAVPGAGNAMAPPGAGGPAAANWPSQAPPAEAGVTHDESGVISVGSQLPSGVLKRKAADGSIEDVDVKAEFGGKKVVLFGVPGAFTPTCSNEHLPGYVERHEAITAAGFDVVACMAVNDAHVMAAWGESCEADGKVMMLSDHESYFSIKLGVRMDKASASLGMRCKRFSLVLNDCVVESVTVAPEGVGDTGAEETCLRAKKEPEPEPEAE